MRVLLFATSEVAARAGTVLAATPGVDTVASLAGSTHRTPFATADTTEGFDVLVGDAELGPMLDRMAEHPIPLVLSAPPQPETTTTTIVSDCSLRGLAVAVAVHRGGTTVAMTVPWAAPPGRRRFSFPPPVGERLAEAAGTVAGIAVWEAPVDGPWAAFRMENHQVLGMVDDRLFVAGLTLAAGVAVITDLPAGAWQPWQQAEAYLAAAGAAGLVVAGL